MYLKIIERRGLGIQSSTVCMVEAVSTKMEVHFIRL